MALATRPTKKRGSKTTQKFKRFKNIKFLVISAFVLTFAGFGVYELVQTYASGTNDRTIRSRLSGRCLDVKFYDLNNGSRPQIWDCYGPNNQTWYRSRDGLILTGTNGRCLDVANQGTSNGSSVQIWDCLGNNNQVWDVYGDGTIRSRASGKCLDVVGYGSANGSQLQIWDCIGGANQKWTVNMTNQYAISGFGGYSCQTTPTLKAGSTGDCVKAVQLAMNNWISVRRYPLAPIVVDGKFGTKTTEAVKHYQSNRLLNSDGVVGASTWDVILNDCAAFGYCSNNLNDKR